MHALERHVVKADLQQVLIVLGDFKTGRGRAALRQGGLEKSSGGKRQRGGKQRGANGGCSDQCLLPLMREAVALSLVNHG